MGYELIMCVHSAQELGRQGHPAIVQNALLEAVLIHARQLIDFLIRNPTRDDDMIRSDFGGGDWTPSPADAVARLDSADLRDLINKHLAHLTWGRIAPEPPAWEVASIVEDLIVVAAEWGKSLQEKEPGPAEQMRILIEVLRGGHRTSAGSPSAH